MHYMNAGWRERIGMWAEWLVVSLLFGSALYEIWASPGGSWPGSPVVSTLLATAIIVPVLFRSRFPLAVLVVIIAASAVQYANGGNAFQPFFAFILALYAVAAHSELRRAVLGGVIGAILVLATDAGKLLEGESVGEVVPAWFILAGVWAFGRWMRSRRFQTRELEDRAARLEVEREEKARAAVADERSRIARELHDVIAHSVSVMVIQAQAAQRLLEGEQNEARQALGSIETTGRQALAEMRRLLGILRRTDAEPALAPQPGLENLVALVEQAREAGLPVELSIEGDAEALPPGVDLTAYRIVQEALTNVRKHAGPASASVTVRRGDDGIELEIKDDGPGTGKNGGSGQGLIGMRERVALYGGTLESGKRSDGGYLVRAKLPVDTSGP